MSPEPSLILLTRPGCHLCERVWEPLAALAGLHGLRLEERDVDSDPQTRARFGERIPVLLWAGRVIAEGSFTPQAALDQLLRRSRGPTVR